MVLMKSVSSTIKRSFSLLCVCLLSAVFFIKYVQILHSAHAQATGNGGIAIEASEGIEWLRDEQKYIARGQASARQDDMNVTADILTAYYRSEEEGGEQTIFRLDAEGNVRVNSGQNDVYGDQAVYYLDEEVAIVVGDGVRLIAEDIAITAQDSLEYWQGKQIAVARGKATVTREGQTMIAGMLVARLKQNQDNEQIVERVDATDGVRISTDEEIILGQEGVYDVINQSAVICGKVKITRGQNQLNGDCAEVNMQTGYAKLKGGDSKVTGLILPSRKE